MFFVNVTLQDEVTKKTLFLSVSTGPQKGPKIDDFGTPQKVDKTINDRTCANNRVASSTLLGELFSRVRRMQENLEIMRAGHVILEGASLAI